MAVAAGGTGTADLLVLSSPGSPALMMYGPAGRALGSGPAAVLGNPALSGDGFSASGGRWNLSTTAVSAAGGISPGQVTFAAGLTYIGKGGLVRRDQFGQAMGEYAFSSGSALAGLSFPMGGRFRGGLSAGLAWEDPGTGTGTGLTASAGVAGEPLEGLRFGVGVTGLGSAPSWNGIRKDMPVTVSAGAEWSASRTLGVFMGGDMGFSTAGSLGGGIQVSIDDLTVSAGYSLYPGERETTGIFGGFRYSYESGGTYIIEAAFAQRESMDWPLMAGISVML